jgi:uncharacterized membrane-anchored protein
VSPRGLRVAALVLVALAQLAVPVSMIFGHERTLREGTAWRFRTAPVDPADAFRGRYVALAFEESSAPVAAGERIERGEHAYVGLAQDREGFAVLGPVRAARPASGDYLKLRVQWIENGAEGQPGSAQLELPFDRLYLEESVAPRAEEVYRESQRATGDARRPAWAVVRVREGHAALEDVMVEGRSLRELAGRGGG